MSEPAELVFDSEVFLTLRFNIFQTNNGFILLVLYLQADNSSKDNKNKFVIIFLAMLVKANILKKVSLMHPIL